MMISQTKKMRYKNFKDKTLMITADGLISYS